MLANKDRYIELELYQRKLIFLQRKAIPQKMQGLFYPVRYKFFYGGRGGAKSVSIAKYILNRGDKEKLRILCTREIQNSIRDSVYSLLKDLIAELDYTNYEIKEKTIVNIKTGTEFIFCGLWGQDKKQTMKSLANVDVAWIEEAQAVSKGSLDILDPTIRKIGSELIFSFNRLFPTDPVWSFMLMIEDEKKVLQKINYYDNNFLPDDLLQQALRSKKAYEDGISDDYLHIWEGEPVGFSDKTIIPVSLIYDAINRNASDEGMIEIGVDVARFGSDRTVFFKRKGYKILDFKTFERQDIMKTAGYLIDFVGRNNNTTPIKIDDTGLGGGLTDYMKSLGHNVIPINFGARAKNADKYFNCVSEMWFEFKEMLPKLQIPNNQDLISELSSREWTIDNQGRRRVESKDDYKKRGFRSPDIADALLICFYIVQTEAVFMNVW